ncbi:hypothetical protein K469DRAFT_697992 [Zopfia rhizophila CBS 207.26]|uniref:C2H2-type domain-containing protein n=1 Tax=Zopfia rhizophila CBS 207.26 TaxID=1314779 RepID=A0A6A6ELJ2_9PEZI|nr:hypothetical protein K469DRAFT_697992 [Zopfia rhizophila CBS 207.26]
MLGTQSVVSYAMTIYDRERKKVSLPALHLRHLKALDSYVLTASFFTLRNTDLGVLGDIAETYLVDYHDTCPLQFGKIIPGEEFHHNLAYHLQTIACFEFPRDVQGGDEESHMGSDAPQPWSGESRLSLGSELLSFPETSPEFRESKRAPYDERTFNAATESFHDASQKPSQDFQFEIKSDDAFFAIKPERGNSGQAHLSKPSMEVKEPKPGFTSEGRIQCHVGGCSAEFDRLADLKLHMRPHGVPGLLYRMNNCGARFFRFDQFE